MKKYHKLKLFSLFLAYLSTGILGLKVGAVNTFATSVWAPSGIALAFLLKFGIDLWPGILSAAFLVNLFAGASILSAATIGIGNTLEACAAFCILNKLIKGPLSLNRLTDVAKLVVFGALLSTLISPIFGVTNLWVHSKIPLEDLRFAFLTWWLGDMTGILIVTPLFLAWSSSSSTFRNLVWPDFGKWSRAAELILLSTITTGLCILIFGATSELSEMLKPHYIFPFLVWAAIRFGHAGATVIVLLITSIAIWGTVNSYGPFSTGLRAENLFNLQAFMAMVSASVSMLAAIITEKHSIQRTLQKNAKELERSNAELEKFAYLASHDLKEPLRTISTRLDLLKEDLKGKLDSEAEEHINFSISASLRMQSLIKALLSYAQVGKGNPSLHTIDVNLELKKIIDLMQTEIQREQARITTAPLPMIQADPLLFGQVFQNIISNALKFKKNDSPPEIDIGGQENKSEWIFYIRDNGVGFSMKYAKSIFEVFRRLQTSEIAGTGIGLALCKKIIEYHGGKIWVESEIGTGSTFYFSIPKNRNLLTIARF